MIQREPKGRVIQRVRRHESSWERASAPREGMGLWTTRLNHDSESVGILCALLVCQGQSMATIPSKSGDGGHTLSLTGNATAMHSV